MIDLKFGTVVREVGGRQRQGYIESGTGVPNAYGVRLTHIDGHEAHEVNRSTVRVFAVQFLKGQWVVESEASGGES